MLTILKLEVIIEEVVIMDIMDNSMLVMGIKMEAEECSSTHTRKLFQLVVILVMVVVEDNKCMYILISQCFIIGIISI